MTSVFNTLSTQELKSLLMPSCPNSVPWLLRKSRETNMLTVTFAFIYNNQYPNFANIRYAKTNEGFFNASTNKPINVQAIEKEEDIAQLIRLIISQPVTVDTGSTEYQIPLLLENQIKPINKLTFTFPDK